MFVFLFKNTKDNQVLNKKPSPLTLMLNFTIPVLSGQPESEVTPLFAVVSAL